MKKTLLPVILIFIFLLVSAQETLREMRIVGKAKKSDEIVPVSIKDVNGKRAACIIFLTDLETAMEFKPNVQLVKYITKPGRHEIYVQPGERAIEVYATGYKPLDVILVSYGIPYLEEGDVYHLELTGDKKKDFSLVVISNPADAEKWLDGELLGTGESYQITSGEHDLEVKKKGFTTITRKFTAEQAVTTFKDIKLLPAMPAIVKITTEPEGAAVYLNNLKFGVTPIESFFDVGTYPIKIEKEGFEIIESKVTINENGLILDYLLNDLRSTLTVKTYLNATVNFNGESYKGGIENYKIAPQILRITVTMPKADPIDKIITIIPKSIETIEVFPEIEKGVIQVTIIPSTAVFELKGDSGEYYKGEGRSTFIDVPAGKYELVAREEGYKTLLKNIDLKNNDSLLEQIKLEEGSDSSEETEEYIKEKMVLVEGGSYTRDEKKYNGEVALIDGFYISKFEVSQEEWISIMNNNPSDHIGGSFPVEKISWYDAIEFCNKKSKEEGLIPCYFKDGEIIECNMEASGYRLPTEAEWEYAARGGSTGSPTTYAGSNKIDEVAWYDGNSRNKTHDVGNKKPNALGIHDMSGNVWEWCWDWYEPIGLISGNNPTGPYKGKEKVIKGGSWSSDRELCYINYRNYHQPKLNFNARDTKIFSTIGFRIVKKLY